MDKIFRRATQSSGTVKKKKDEKARKRNMIINFRVSPVEKKLIESRIQCSGLSKAEFFIESCLYQKILVKANVRAFREIDQKMSEIVKALNVDNRLENLEPELLESIKTILELIKYLYDKEEDKIP